MADSTAKATAKPAGKRTRPKGSPVSRDRRDGAGPGKAPKTFPGSPFKLHSAYEPTGDQPDAIDKLHEGLLRGDKWQTLLGVTGSGKTFTMANVIARAGRPTLVISHNKTLAAQLYEELKSFFPENAVEYFVSYYDYYQPEAYVPSSDTYISKEIDINAEIEKMRYAATQAILTRPDTIIVSSVSCIYGLGSPEEYEKQHILLAKGQTIDRDALLGKFVDIHYTRNNMELKPGTFRARGDNVEVRMPGDDEGIRIELWGDEVERIGYFDLLTGETLRDVTGITIFPAKHFVLAEGEMAAAIGRIEEQLRDRLAELRAQDKLLEAARLEQRTRFDLEMIRELGYCNGIENYSQPLTGRPRGSPPFTLIDYFPDDLLMVIDESHATVPQVRGMYNGDRARKTTLVDFGFRLPSALDNRPLKFDEFEKKVASCVFTSATPGPYEREVSTQVAEQVIRPTGLIDPEIEVRPQQDQVDDLLAEIRRRSKAGERVLVTTLTKRMAEDLTKYYKDAGVRVEYLHSDIDTLERILILESLRRGEYDVLVGINLLREGLDLPEVSLVAILDADKYGFLRSETSLIQTIGRAARHINGKVIMYGQDITPAMATAIDTTNERRKRQVLYNEEHGITPRSVVRDVKAAPEGARRARESKEQRSPSLNRLRKLSDQELEGKDRKTLIEELTKLMKQAAQDLEFEKAALLRDKLIELKT
ncbi:MAG: excinuclease ABC subunit UvrB, partial [Euryarchaeota archaeon]|nr:excinuclease ABC subunit UvrB [Euryarchaeota archaeon]